MSDLDRQLAYLDYQVEAAYARIEDTYDTPRFVLEETKDRAWQELESLVYQRELLRARYSGRTVPLDVTVRVFTRQVSEAFAEFGERLLELAGPHMAAFSRLSEAAGLSSAVLKRLMKEGEAARKPGPRQVFSPVALGAGPIGVLQFRAARPANRRPVLPGYMTQKGKG